MEIGNEWWSLLGPQEVNKDRRVRTLGLAPTVRSFNDLAVPGLGGVWFGKQVFLATIGVVVAERARLTGSRVQNIEVANAIEATACWFSLKGNAWNSDPRLRGGTKLPRQADLTFASVSRPSFYVTQPMRMATVQPLLALGLVDASAERFNAFGSSRLGVELVEAFCDGIDPCHYSNTALSILVHWVEVGDKSLHPSVAKALSLLTAPVKAAQELLRSALMQGDGEDADRRRRALKWVEEVRLRPAAPIAWGMRPSCLSEAHWRDIEAGARFFNARDAALGMLDTLEAAVALRHDQRVSLAEADTGTLSEQLEPLKIISRKFLEIGHDPTPAAGARQFCAECAHSDAQRTVELLVQRDGSGLRMVDKYIVPGPAFRGSQPIITQPKSQHDPEDSDVSVETALPLPEGTSHRVRNLFLMNLDLQGKLGEWLGRQSEGRDR